MFNDLLEGSFTTATTATTASSEATCTLETLMEAKAKIEALGPEPIGELMRSNGADPDKGWILLIPSPDFETLDFGMFGPPSYVKSARIISEPIMVNPKLIGLPYNVKVRG